MDGIALPPAFRLPADALTAQSPTPLTILPDVPTLDEHFAAAVAAEIRANNQQGAPTRLSLPVGPVGYLPRLAQLSNVNLADATARGILVTNTPDGPTESTAEHTVTMLLALAKRLKQADANMAAGKWGHGQGRSLGWKSRIGPWAWLG